MTARANEYHCLALKNIVCVAKQEFEASLLAASAHSLRQFLQILALLYKCYLNDVHTLCLGSGAGSRHHTVCRLNHRLVA